MMKKLKRIVTAVFVFGLMLCTFYAKAETFENTPGLREALNSSVRASRAVVLKGFTRKSIAEVCESRIQGLRGILRNADKSDIMNLVSNYAGACSLPRDKGEIVLLYRSRSASELRHNVQVLIEIYKGIKPRCSTEAAPKPSTKACPVYDGRRENRKGGYRDGEYLKRKHGGHLIRK